MVKAPPEPLPAGDNRQPAGLAEQFNDRNLRKYPFLHRKSGPVLDFWLLRHICGRKI